MRRRSLPRRPNSIGKIEKVVGDVTVVRNGVSVALHVGDAVFKSDVVATGASSSCGISFPDGTALNLVANTRMALNDYAFDANSNSTARCSPWSKAPSPSSPARSPTRAT